MANVNVSLPVLTGVVGIEIPMEASIASPARSFMAKLIFPSLTLDSHYIKTIEWNGSLISGDDFEIGTAIADRLSCVLVDMDGYFTSYDFANREFTLQFGIYYDATWHYTTIGLFTVEEAIRKNGIVTLSSIDRMYKFDTEYTGTLTYPQTLLQILQDVCTQCGVTLVSTTFTNYDFSVAVAPSYYGVTCRRIVEQIAELAGGYARINVAGNLEIITLGNGSARAIPKANYMNRGLTRDETAEGLIDKVIVMLGEEMAEAGTGTHPYTVANNMFCTDPNDFATSLYGVLNGLSFSPMTLKWQGDYTLPLGRRLYVDDSFYTYLLKRTLKYNGGIIEEYVTPAKSDVIKNSTVSGSIRIAMNNMISEIRVMKDEISLKVGTDVTDDLGALISANSASISVLSGQIASKVSSTDLTTALTSYTLVSQTATDISFAVGVVQEQVDVLNDTQTDLLTNFTFNSTGFVVGQGSFKMVLSATELGFYEGGTAEGDKVSWINGKKMYVTTGEFTQSIIVGKHKIEYNTSTNSTLVTWVG